jgi:Flp pilus assembly protein TadG
MSSLWPGWARFRVRRIGVPPRSRPLRASPPDGARRARRVRVAVPALRFLSKPGRSRGQSLVELALVTPILLLLLLGAVDMGRLFYAEIAVTNAAREGAMVAATSPTSYVGGAACDASTNAVTCAATREGQGGFVTVSPTDVAMACSPSCTKAYGTTVTVTVTGHFQLLTPLMWVFTGGPNVTFDRSADADVVITPTAGGFATPSPSPTASPTPSSSSSPTPTPTTSPTPTATATCPSPLVLFTTYQKNKNWAIDFTSTSTPTSGTCAISYWRWDFGDGTTSAGAVGTTSHDYGKANEGKTFNVTLTVTTPSGTFFYILAVTTLS